MFFSLDTFSGAPSLSQVRVGGGTASDLHSRVTCLFCKTDTSCTPLSPAMLGGTVGKNIVWQMTVGEVIFYADIMGNFAISFKTHHVL